LADEPRPCGLYRTSRAHPERATQLPSGRLVYFHNHSDAGVPIALLPKVNKANRWNFESKGFLVRDPTWPASLVPLRAEGFYRLADAVRMKDGRVAPEGQVVQLGYNGAGEAIAFFATWDAEANALAFPSKGTKLTERAIDRLVALTVGGPTAPRNPEHA
jgi:hypothetical protein